MQDSEESGAQGEKAGPKSEANQASNPTLPSHPVPPEAGDDELTREALNDPGTEDRDVINPIPPLWRAVLLILLVCVSLSVVFWRWR